MLSEVIDDGSEDFGSTSVNTRSSAKKRKRQTTTPRLKWTDEMEMEVFEYANNSTLSGRGFEKPTAADYYKKFLETSVLCKMISLEKLVQHMKNIKRSYATALAWRGKTGEGILQYDPLAGATTIEGELLKRCKYFKEMDELLGDKPQFNPPYMHHSDMNLSPPNDISGFGEVDPSDLQRNVNIEFDESEVRDTIMNGSKDEGTEVFAESGKVKKKPRKSPLKSAAAALESAMVSRVECENKRLEWEKECELQKRTDEMQRAQGELSFRQQQFEFERQKWQGEMELRKSFEERQFQLEKLKIEKDAEIARFRIEKELEIQRQQNQ